jgi:very-short-patch-repair endonuclease
MLNDSKNENLTANYRNLYFCFGGFGLTKIYNKKTEKEKRRLLRKKMTKAEVLLWLELKNKKLGVRFLRQYSVGKFVVDFYSPEIKLVIEVDGLTHITKEEIEYDNIRQSNIEKLNFIFLRITNPEIYDDMFNVLEKIKSKISELHK